MLARLYDGERVPGGEYSATACSGSIRPRRPDLTDIAGPAPGLALLKPSSNPGETAASWYRTRVSGSQTSAVSPPDSAGFNRILTPCRAASRPATNKPMFLETLTSRRRWVVQTPVRVCHLVITHAEAPVGDIDQDAAVSQPITRDNH